MSCNAGIDEESEMDNPKAKLLASDAQAQQLEEVLQDECQKHICCDLRPSQGVNQRVTILTPEIPRVAWHDAFKLNEDRLPIPEPTVTNGEDDGGYSKGPDEEIYSDIPSRVDRAATSLK